MLGRYFHKRGQLGEDAKDRTGKDGDLVRAPGNSAEGDLEIPRVRVQLHVLLDAVKLPGQLRIDVLLLENEDDRFPPVLVGLNADAGVAGDLRPAKRPDEPRECRIGGTELSPGDAAVPHAVDRLHGEVQHHVGRVTRLEQLKNGDGRDRGSQVAYEQGSRLRRVGDRGPVLVGFLVVEGRPQLLSERGQVADRRDDAPGGGGGPLERVTARDLGHVEEKGRVQVAQLDDVQKRLFLPRRGDRVVVGHPVGHNCPWPDVLAPRLNHAEEREQRRRPREASHRRGLREAGTRKPGNLGGI